MIFRKLIVHILFFGSILTVLSSFNQDKLRSGIKKKYRSLVGHWDFSETSAKENYKGYAHYLSTDLKLSKSAVSKLINQMNELNLLYGSIDFNKDGSFIQYTNGNVIQSGKWIMDSHNSLVLEVDAENMVLGTEKLKNKPAVVNEVDKAKLDLKQDQTRDKSVSKTSNSPQKEENIKNKVHEYNDVWIIK